MCTIYFATVILLGLMTLIIFVHLVLVGKPEARRLLGSPKCGLEDNIKMGPYK
jgi:hypothetical protein